MNQKQKMKLKLAMNQAVSMAVFGDKDSRKAALVELSDFLISQGVPAQQFAEMDWWPSLVPAITEEYPIPKNGWVCFHCGEKFTNRSLAELHFGKTPNLTPACIVKHEELTLAIALRKAEEERDEALRLVQMLQAAALTQPHNEQTESKHVDDQNRSATSQCKNQTGLSVHCGGRLCSLGDRGDCHR